MTRPLVIVILVALLTAGSFVMGQPRHLEMRKKIGAGTLFKPEELTVAHDEIFVLERSDESIKVFSTSGDFKTSIGRKGLGPGEFSMVISFCVRDNRVFVMDNSLQRIHVIRRGNKKYQGFHRYNSPQPGYPPYKLAVSGDGAVFTALTGILKEHKLICRMVLDEDLYKRDKLFLDAAPLFKSLKEIKGPDVRLFLNMGHIDTSKDKVYFVYSLINRVEVFGHDGKKLKEYTLPIPSLGEKAKIVTFGNGSFDLEGQLNYDLKIRKNQLYILSRNETGESLLFRLEKGKCVEICRVKEELYAFDIHEKKLYGLDKDASEILVYDLEI